VKILRSIVAVVLGYALFAASAVVLFHAARRNPHASQSLKFMLFAVVYGIVFAGLGGMIAARIAPAKGTLHAGFVTLLIALGATLSLVARPGMGSTWSQWAALVLMAPSAWSTAILFAPHEPK
jgi:hypothetical protein